MDSETANPTFRESVRRTWTNGTGGDSAADNAATEGATEGTPLLNGGTGHQNGQHRGKAFRILFNTEDTPGRHSSNIAVRVLAQIWHVTKITLLSSKFIATSISICEMIED